MPTTPLFLPGLVKVDHHMSYAGREWHVIRWLFYGISDFSDAELTTIATGAQAAFTPLFNFTSQHNVLDGTTVTDFSSDMGLSHTITAGGVGEETSADLPIQVACEIEWKIRRRYRGGHPKTFLSAMTEGQLDGIDQWATTFIAALETAAAAYIIAMQAVDVVRASVDYFPNLVNVSKFLHGVERLALVIDPIVGAVVNGTTASQRRRRGRI